MLLHNSASVLNPAGHYLFLGGAAYSPIAYYIETSRFQGEALHGGKATSMHTQGHAGDEHFHAWMDKGQSCLSKTISDLPVKMNWMGVTVFPFVIFFLKSTDTFWGYLCCCRICVSLPSCVCISRHSEQSHVSSLAVKCLDWGQSFEMEINSSESQQHEEDTLEDCKGNAGGHKIFSQDPSEIN